MWEVVCVCGRELSEVLSSCGVLSESRCAGFR